jgi:hypothetical protein
MLQFDSPVSTIDATVGAVSLATLKAKILSIMMRLSSASFKVNSLSAYKNWISPSLNFHTEFTLSHSTELYSDK